MLVSVIEGSGQNLINSFNFSIENNNKAGIENIIQQQKTEFVFLEIFAIYLVS